MHSFTPTVGRIVHVPAEALLLWETNGAELAPAIITRVWSQSMINVRVLLDGNSETPWLTSITLHESREAYSRAMKAGNTFGCYWPERVG